MREALEIIINEQAKQQEKTDELYEIFKETKKEDKDYDKIASAYYYANGMNNELIIIRNKIVEEMNK